MNHNSHKFRLTVNGQDVITGDIDDGRPERKTVLCRCVREMDIFGEAQAFADPDCEQCFGRGYREETDAEYWARVEAMTPKSADDLL